MGLPLSPIVTVTVLSLAVTGVGLPLSPIVTVTVLSPAGTGVGLPFLPVITGVGFMLAPVSIDIPLAPPAEQFGVCPLGTSGCAGELAPLCLPLPRSFCPVGTGAPGTAHCDSSVCISYSVRVTVVSGAALVVQAACGVCFLPLPFVTVTCLVVVVVVRVVPRASSSPTVTYSVTVSVSVSVMGPEGALLGAAAWAVCWGLAVTVTVDGAGHASSSTKI